MIRQKIRHLIFQKMRQTIFHSLLHEYIHYLTLCCADTKATDEFMKEGIAEYISMLRCENRMARSINYMLSEKAIQNYIDHGACTSDGKSIDYVKRYYCDAQLFVEGYEVGRQYSTVSIGNTIATRTEEMQNSPNKSNPRTGITSGEYTCMITRDEWENLK